MKNTSKEAHRILNSYRMLCAKTEDEKIRWGWEDEELIKTIKQLEKDAELGKLTRLLLKDKNCPSGNIIATLKAVVE